MLGTATAFLTGTLLLLLQPSLPHIGLLGVILAGLTVAIRSRWFRLLLALALGFVIAWAHAQWALSSRLSKSVVGASHAVGGYVVGLPLAVDDQQRFDFVIETPEVIAGLVHLSWYRNAPKLEPGTRLALTVTLRPPRGTANSGGFDYERWSLVHGRTGSGYVVSGVVEPAPPALSQWVNRQRSEISHWLATSLPGSTSVSLLQGLAVGDRRAISDQQWEVLGITGTGHLIAISGLHIGLIAGLSYALGLLLFRVSTRLIKARPAQDWAVAFAWTGALCYALLAGFTLPTQRALVMLTVVFAARLLRRHISPGHGLAVALIAVLLFDPFAPLSPGFWLSFCAVGVLLLALVGRSGRRRRIHGWLTAQGAIAIGLLPLGIGLFTRLSLVSPLVNLFAIPIVGLVVVPPLLIAIVLRGFIPDLAQWLLFAVDWGMGLILEGLAFAAALPGSAYTLPAPPLPVIALSFAGALLLLTPKGVPGKLPGAVLLALLFVSWQRPLKEGEFDVEILDVGQGLSVVVDTRSHRLVFDTGSSFRNGGSMGQRVLVPYLLRHGNRNVDTLVVSHGDDDHAGGVDALLRLLQPEKILSSVPDRYVGAQRCQSGQSWHWDGVDFKLLHPTPGLPYLGNNSSCVLYIRGPSGAALLPGDISAIVERRLATMESIDADLLVAAHHGSKTSTSELFLETVNPRWVVFPAGWNNRFAMPHEVVLERVNERSVAYLITGDEGAVSARFRQDEKPHVSGYRRTHRRFWSALK